jgi:ABC-type transport system involved in multi-copper enzyme maturation permease subunit
MSAVMTVAALTVREATRRRLVAAFALISVLMVGLSGWGFDRLSHSRSITSGETSVAVSQSVIVFMFMFSFVVALSASAVASLAVSSEIDSGVLQTIIARPIRRSEIVLGKWLGLTGLLAAYTVIVSGLLVAVVDWTSGYVPPNPAAAAAFILAEGVILLTFVLLLSTRLSALASGVIGVAVFGIAWLAGVAGVLGATFKIHGLHDASVVSQYVLPTDGLWHGAIYYLQSSAFIAQQLAGSPRQESDPFFSAAAPPWTYLTWAAIWLVLAVVLSLVSFERRDL